MYCSVKGDILGEDEEKEENRPKSDSNALVTQDSNSLAPKDFLLISGKRQRLLAESEYTKLLAGCLITQGYCRSFRHILLPQSVPSLLSVPSLVCTAKRVFGLEESPPGEEEQEKGGPPGKSEKKKGPLAELNRRPPQCTLAKQAGC